MAREFYDEEEDVDLPWSNNYTPFVPPHIEPSAPTNGHHDHEYWMNIGLFQAPVRLPCQTLDCLIFFTIWLTAVGAIGIGILAAIVSNSPN
jgi:hypothetical protein